MRRLLASNQSVTGSCLFPSTIDDASARTFKRWSSAGRLECRIAGHWAIASGKSAAISQNGMIARVIFFFWNDEMVLLHGFVKKTQRLASQDMALALRRMKEVEG